MRRFLALLAILLLSGCTTPDAGTDGPDAADSAMRTESDVVQRASLSWVAPADAACADPILIPDAAADITYGRVQVDPATHNKPFQVIFPVQDPGGFAVQITFVDAAGDHLDNAARFLFLGFDPVIEGTVPSGAVEAHVTSCGASATSAEYAAGAI